MTRFTVGFYNDLPDSTGHDHHVCQRSIDVPEAHDAAQAVEQAIVDFQRLEDVVDWHLHARTIECAPAKGEEA